MGDDQYVIFYSSSYSVVGDDGAIVVQHTTDADEMALDTISTRFATSQGCKTYLHQQGEQKVHAALRRWYRRSRREA
jgi:hypothetical protein